MSRGRIGAAADIWLRIGLATALALGSLVMLSPARPALRLQPWLAAAAGLGAGVCLFVAASRRRPCLPPARRVGLTAAKWMMIGLLAANEEVIWRRAVLGECLRAGPVAAAAASTVVFALAHRGRTGLHLGTGATFAGLYLATGALVGSIAAHWSYNLLVSARADRRGPSASPR
jgi:membrane protease YdiL (CAAX protease family)